MGEWEEDQGTDGRKKRTDEEITTFPVLALWPATSATVYSAVLLTDLMPAHFYLAFPKQ